GVVVDREAVRFFAFDQHHADRRGCHRHTKYDVHYASKIVCYATSVLSRARSPPRPPTTNFIEASTCGVTCAAAVKFGLRRPPVGLEKPVATRVPMGG